MQPYAAIDVSPDTSRRWSEQVWRQCRWDAIKSGAIDGVYDEDDFQILPADGSGYDILAADSGASAALVATAGALGGQLAMITGSTDNNEVYVQRDGVGPFGEFRSGSGDFFWETRLKISSISNQSFFAGLAVPGVAVANAIVDTTGALVDKSLIGFRTIAASASALDVVYNTLSGGGITVNTVAAATLVADTFIKLGMRYDDRSKKIYFFVNGTIVAGVGVAITAANVPDSIGLSTAYLLKTTSGSASKTLTVDRWRACVEGNLA